MKHPFLVAGVARRAFRAGGTREGRRRFGSASTGYTGPRQPTWGWGLMQRLGQRLFGPADFYEGRGLFNEQKKANGWLYDWTDMPQWQRKEWAERERNGQNN